MHALITCIRQIWKGVFNEFSQFIFDKLQNIIMYFLLQSLIVQGSRNLDQRMNILFTLLLGPSSWQSSWDVSWFCLPCCLLWSASWLPRWHVRLLGHLVLLLLVPVVRLPLLHLRHPCRRCWLSKGWEQTPVSGVGGCCAQQRLERERVPGGRHQY